MILALFAVFLGISFIGLGLVVARWTSGLVLRVHEDVSKAAAGAVAEVVTEVATTVAREVGLAIRGPMPTPETEEEAGQVGVQEQAFVSQIAPWESWGEDQIGDGDVRYTPDPTDGLIPDEDEGEYDGSRRAVNVPPGFTIPTQPNMAGERYGMESNGG